MSVASLPEDLSSLREANFDWAVSLRDVWRDLPYDVPQLHATTRGEFHDKLQAMRRQSPDSSGPSPLGWVLIGAGGSGKTHLLGAMRAEAARQHGAFVLVDMTDVRDFWLTTLHGFLDSLHAVDSQGRPQHSVLLKRLVATVSADGFLDHNLQVLAHRDDEALMVRDVDRLLKGLATVHGRQARLHQDAFRALVYLGAMNDETSAAGLAWLQGHSLPEATSQRLKLQNHREDARQIIRELSWWMSLSGPTVVAYDQLDPIVHQVAPVAQAFFEPPNVAAHSVESTSGAEPNDLQEVAADLAAVEDLDPLPLHVQQARQQAARSVIEQIGGGLSAMRDVCSSTLVVVSCVESTWTLLNDHVLSTYRDRFEEPVRLASAGDQQVLEALIRNRLQPAFDKGRLAPPYPTWPFRESAIAEMAHETPREVLKLCDAHRRACMAAGEVVELQSFAHARRRTLAAANANALAALDELFHQACEDVDVERLIDEEAEDTHFADALRAALRCWLIQEDANRPSHLESVLDCDFPSTGGRPPLHARVRIIDHQQHDRETHVCLRALQRSHHSAFRTRLQNAMAQSGIDPNLDFRRLWIVRCGEPPAGESVQRALEEFALQGGRLHQATADELRRWAALEIMAEQQDPLFELWLQQRRPLADAPWC